MTNGSLEGTRSGEKNSFVLLLLSFFVAGAYAKSEKSLWQCNYEKNKMYTYKLDYTATFVFRNLYDHTLAPISQIKTNKMYYRTLLP